MFAASVTIALVPLAIAAATQYEHACALALEPAIHSAAATTPGLDSQYALSLGKPRPVEAVLTFELQLPNYKATDWIVLAASPPTLAAQTHASARLEPRGEEYVEPAAPGRRMLRARLVPGKGATQRGVSVRVEYKAHLASRHLVRREPGERYYVPERLTSAEREAYVSANELYDFKSPGFQQWLRESRLLREPSEGDIDFAQRIFLALKPKLRYEYKPEMDRQASNVCRTLVSDCGGMSLLFASVMRANEIPARVLAGRWAVSSKPGAIVGEMKYLQQHVKAEFYARSVGWVPVDMSSAVEHDPDPSSLRCFGHDRGNFLTVHIDPLVSVVDGRSVKRTFNWLQGIHYFFYGKGDSKEKISSESWKVWWPERTLAESK